MPCSRDNVPSANSLRPVDLNPCMGLLTPELEPRFPVGSFPTTDATLLENPISTTPCTQVPTVTISVPVLRALLAMASSNLALIPQGKVRPMQTRTNLTTVVSLRFRDQKWDIITMRWEDYLPPRPMRALLR